MVATVSADGSRLYCGSFGGILGTALAKVEVPPELYRVTCLSRLIALPKSDGGSIAPTVSRYLRQSVSPRPALIIFVVAHDGVQFLDRPRRREAAGIIHAATASELESNLWILKRAIEIAAGIGVAPAHQRTSSDDIRVRNVRFSSKSGHCRTTLGCPLSAISRHPPAYF
jgi:hypothetical protein